MNLSIDEATVRVTTSNLLEETKEKYLHDLFTTFGIVNQVVLIKDKNDNSSNGHAFFIKFNEKKDAQTAIECVSKFDRDHFILKIEWAWFVYSKFPFF